MELCKVSESELEVKVTELSNLFKWVKKALLNMSQWKISSTSHKTSIVNLTVKLSAYLGNVLKLVSASNRLWVLQKTVAYGCQLNVH